MIIRTPDYRLRVFVSSTLKELAEERKVVRQAILRLRLAPIMFESGARPHPAQKLYKSYLAQSQIFIGIYWQSYGWVAPGMQISGLEDEYQLSAGIPRLIYIKNPAPDREAALEGLLDRIRDDNTSCYTYYSTPAELKELVQNDLALLLTERFEAVEPTAQAPFEVQQPSPTNVPVPRNALIGREREMAIVRSLLLRDNIALVTLTGTGGTGKSRLALQIGVEMLDHFKDGVYLVMLEPISDPDLVIPTIAETLGIRENPGSRSVREILNEFLRDKQMLLLLDNFEQVVEAAPDVAQLLEACPRLKAVVTSRTPLRLRAEKEIPVPPLAVPSLKELFELNTLSQYGAVELFIQRAQAVKPDFTITDANAPAVAEICYRLDGLPLAIELAAARIKMLTPHELRARLGHIFDLLSGGTRDLPERQRTLRGAIDWSYNLLNETEKKLFRRLAIFVGGWTLDAAETICDLDGDLAQSLDDTLASLIDNNLVIRAQETEEQSRFGMLTTIHEYALERLLASDEADLVRCQFAQYYLDFIKMVEPRIRSSERVRWLHVMMKEIGNIRGVLEWIATTGNCLEVGQRIVIMLGGLWVTSGYSNEGRRWCAQIMSVSDESTPQAIRAGLLGVAGWIAWAQGEHFSAQACVDESLDLFGSLVEITVDEKYTYAAVMLVRGMLASSLRDLAVATAMYQRSIELLKEVNDQWYQALAYSFLGEIALYNDDNEGALALHNQSVKLAREQGDPWCLMPSLMSTAQWAIVEGDLAKARSLLLESEDLLRKTGDRWSLSWVLNDLGHVALMENNLDQAGDYFLEGVILANAFGNRNVLLNSLAGAAALIARRSVNPQDPQKQSTSGLTQAARICGAISPNVEMSMGFMWPTSTRIFKAAIAQAQSLMAEDFWNEAYVEGQSMTINEVIELATQSLKK